MHPGNLVGSRPDQQLFNIRYITPTPALPRAPVTDPHRYVCPGEGKKGVGHEISRWKRTEYPVGRCAIVGMGEKPLFQHPLTFSQLLHENQI